MHRWHWLRLTFTTKEKQTHIHTQAQNSIFPSSENNNNGISWMVYGVRTLVRRWRSIRHMPHAEKYVLSANSCCQNLFNYIIIFAIGYCIAKPSQAGPKHRTNMWRERGKRWNEVKNSSDAFFIIYGILL